MKRALIVTIALLALVSGMVLSAQEYHRYELNGVLPCASEQISKILDLLIELAALAAAGDTPEDFRDTVMQQAKLQFVEQLESSSAVQRQDLRNKIALGIRYAASYDAVSDGYDLIMSSFWDNPIICKEALEIIQRVNDTVNFHLFYLDAYWEVYDTSRALDIAAARRGLPLAGVGKLVDYLLENR